jgi:hypothetical protein
MVQVNVSGSLGCLLQSKCWGNYISIQIHALLKQYISDAQNKQLQGSTLNKVVAANLNWAKAGAEVTIMESPPNLFMSLISISRYAMWIPQMAHLTDQASADPSGNPVGSWCQSVWRLGGSRYGDKQSHHDDLFTYTSSLTKSTRRILVTGVFANPYDY